MLNQIFEILNMKHRIKFSWKKQRKASEILFNKRIPIRLKSKFYKIVGEACSDVQIKMLDGIWED